MTGKQPCQAATAEQRPAECLLRWGDGTTLLGRSNRNFTAAPHLVHPKHPSKKLHGHLRRPRMHRSPVHPARIRAVPWKRRLTRHRAGIQKRVVRHTGQSRLPGTPHIRAQNICTCIRRGHGVGAAHHHQHWQTDRPQTLRRERKPQRGRNRKYRLDPWIAIALSRKRQALAISLDAQRLSSCSSFIVCARRRPAACRASPAHGTPPGPAWYGKDRKSR